MTKPLVSSDPKPRDVQFSHFGVLDDGSSSKGAFATSIMTNLVILALVIVVGNAVKNKIAPPKEKVMLTDIVKEKPPAPKPPPPPPPKIKLPEPPKIEEPKIQPPKIKLPDPIKPPPEIKPVVVPVPKPVNIAPPAPKKVDPPPAPKVINMAKAMAASVPNNDAHPTPVRLGSATSPISSSMTGPAVSKVNLSSGMAGMPPTNGGSGPRASAVNFGSGSPAGSNLSGKSNAPMPIKGLSTGVTGGTGTGSHGPVVVQVAPTPVKVATPVAAAVVSQAKPPVVTYIPKPTYSAEARAMHLEGDALVKVIFRANGKIQVLGLSHGLGHGLDQAALDCAQGIQYKPGTDAAGAPVDFPTTVTVHFLVN